MWSLEFMWENPSLHMFDHPYVSPLYDTLILTASFLCWLAVSHMATKLVEERRPNYCPKRQQCIVHHVTKFIFATFLTPYVIQCVLNNWHILNNPFNPGEFDQKAMEVILFSTGYTIHLWFRSRHSHGEVENKLFKMDCEYLVMFVIVHMYAHQFSRLYIIYSLTIIHDIVHSLFYSLIHYLPNQYPLNLVMRMLMSLDYATFLVFRAFLLLSLVVCFLVENVINSMSYYNYISILHILNAMENRNLVHWVELFDVNTALNEEFCAMGMVMISFWQHKYHPEWIMLKLLSDVVFGPEIWNILQYKILVYFPRSIHTLLMNTFEDWP